MTDASFDGWPLQSLTGDLTAAQAHLDGASALLEIMQEHHDEFTGSGLEIDNELTQRYVLMWAITPRVPLSFS